MIKFRTIFLITVIFCLTQDIGSAQWSLVFGPVGNFVRVQCFAEKGTKLFGGTLNGGVYFTADNANTEWPAAKTGLTDTNVRVLIANGSNLFAGTGSGVFLSTNEGTNWTAVNNGLANVNVQSLVVKDGNLFAGTLGGVFISTDNGAYWDTVNNGLTSLSVTSLVVKGANIFAGTASFVGGGVFISSDNGANWNLASDGLTNTNIQSLTVCGINLFAVIQGATVFASTNDGTVWTPANGGLPSTFELHLSTSGTNLFAGTYGSGVYLSTNYGVTWSSVNGVFGPAHVNALAAFGSYLFAAHYDGSVYRRSLSEMVTSVQDTKAMNPAQFELSQNYPNPFNPTTEVSFHINEGGFVSLKIYNIIGKEIATLTNKELDAGTYRYNWDARNQPSGVYYYKLSTKYFYKIKNMVLMK
jgi:hypothetical protein